jgi:RNA polymerase sigma-70 factor (family 1)
MAPYSSHTDQQLVELLKNSDEGAFKEIYDRYWDKLYSTALHRMGLEQEAKEVVQDVFYKLWRKRGHLQLHYSLATYLATAVKYEVINRFAAKSRELRYRTRVAEEFADFQPGGIQEDLEFAELEQQLALLVRALPEKCRIAFRLSREAGLSQKQIAEEMGIAEKTVEAHISQALRRLRVALRLFFQLFF